MNYFLMMVILGLCGGAYYEYNILQQKSAEDRQQISDLGSKIDALQSENKKLGGDTTKLTKSAADYQAEIVDLTKQVQTAQSALAEAQEKAHLAAQATAVTPVPAVASAPPTNNLGTIITLGGKTYLNCQLLKVDTDGIVINDSEGITKVLYGLLPPDLQKKFGYDPHQAAALTEAQIQYQEEQRKAAAEAAGK